MYLHLGANTVINQEKIVVILDLDTANKEIKPEYLLGKLKKNNEITYVSEEGKEKSLIITKDGYYFSPISTTTLLKRSSFLNEREE